MNERTCARCKQTFPATTEYFRKDSGKTLGIAYYCLDCARTKSRDRFAALPPEKREVERLYMLAYMKRAHLDCLVAYGGDPPSCACCGEEEISFLTLDHIDGDGKAHRASARNADGKVQAGPNFYRWLAEQGFPPGIQVLCFNCNQAKRTYRACPHQQGGGTISRRLIELVRAAQQTADIRPLVRERLGDES
jgi:hypothetical protein